MNNFLYPDPFGSPPTKEQKQIEKACFLSEFEFTNTKIKLGHVFLDNTQFKQNEVHKKILTQSIKYWIWWSFEFDSFLIRQNELNTPWDQSLWYSLIPTITQSPLLMRNFNKSFKQ